MLVLNRRTEANEQKTILHSNHLLVALLVLFEVVLFIAFGGERLEQSGWVKWLCAGAPVLIVLLSFLRDYIIKVKFGGSNE